MPATLTNQPTGKLKCPMCGSDDMVVSPKNSYTAVLACNVCTMAFEIPIGTPTPETPETPQTQPETTPAPEPESSTAPDADWEDGDGDPSDEQMLDELLDETEKEAEARKQAQQEASETSGQGEASDGDATGESTAGGSTAASGGSDSEEFSDGDCDEPAPGSGEQAGEPGGGQPGGNSAGDWSQHQPEPYKPSMHDVEVDPNQYQGNRDSDIKPDRPEKNELAAAHGRQRGDTSDQRVQTFYRRVGDVMVDNKFDRLVGGKRSGKIVPTALHRVASGAQRIFARPEERLNKHYNVLFVIDGSGSMNAPVYAKNSREPLKAKPHTWNQYDLEQLESWKRAAKQNPAYQTYVDNFSVEMSRAHMAADLAALMIAGLERYDISFGVIMYGNQAEIIKDFSSKTPDLQKLEQRMASWYRNSPHAGSTQTYTALRAAEQMLAGRDGHNVIVFMTDGQANDSGRWTHPRTGEVFTAGLGIPVKKTGSSSVYNEPMQYLRAFGKELQRKADIISIGIQTDTVKSWAPNPHVAHSRDEFMSLILTEFSKFIKRG